MNFKKLTIKDNIPSFLPKGVFSVKNSFSISYGGAWAIRFPQSAILFSDGAGCIKQHYRGDVILKKPPIEGTTIFEITKYGDSFDQVKVWNRFVDNLEMAE